MSWVRIDDKAWTHEKIASLSPPALRLWLFALCRCNQYETDGHVTKAALRLLGGSPRQVAELVAARLWEPADDGWQVHDYLNYQPSKAKLAAEREATAARVRRHRQRSGEPATTVVETALPAAAETALPAAETALPAGGVTALVTPPPSRPVPSRPVPPADSAGERAGSVAGPIPCPADLALLPAQLDQLEIAPGIPRKSAVALAASTVSRWVSDPDDRKPLVRWRKQLVVAVQTDWNRGVRPVLEQADDAEERERAEGIAAQMARRKQVAPPPPEHL